MKVAEIEINRRKMNAIWGYFDSNKRILEKQPKNNHFFQTTAKTY